MKFKNLVVGTLAASAGMLIYGALVESKRLKLEDRILKLEGWPEDLNGVTIAVLADLHIRDRWSLDLAKRAIGMAVKSNPDFIVFPGDFVAFVTPQTVERLEAVLQPLATYKGRMVACLGNHDFWNGDHADVVKALKRCGVKVLENEAVLMGGIAWCGVGDATMGRHKPADAMAAARKLGAPIVTLWHEPDAVDWLPDGSSLMISGHSHGGQWRFPGGFTPIFTELGKKYPRGFYPEARTPLYVSRGVGTTGPPARFNCPPEVSLLRLTSKPECKIEGQAPVAQWIERVPSKH